MRDALVRRRAPRRTGERGFTLVEVMLATLVMVLVMAGATLFLISQAQTQRRSYDRTDIQRSGRAAMTIMANEISKTGLGLPNYLAIRLFANPGTSGDSCDTTPELSVAAVNYLREWTVASATAASVTLADATPTGAADARLESGQWMFIYQNDSAAGADSGHGMVRLGAARSAGDVALTIDSVNFSTAQPSLDLAQAAFNSPSGGGHAPVILAADVSTFGVNCDDANNPYVYWRRGGEIVVLAAGADTTPLAAAAPQIGAAAGDVVALRFRFLVDDDGDGVADDKDGSEMITVGDLVSSPTSLANVTAIEVTMRLRTALNASTGTYDTKDFVQLIATPNIHTRTGAPYIFVDNTGL